MVFVWSLMSEPAKSGGRHENEQALPSCHISVIRRIGCRFRGEAGLSRPLASMSGLPRSQAYKPQVMDLSHLLNFTLPPRQSRPIQSIPRRSRKTANTHGVWNKERQCPPPLFPLSLILTTLCRLRQCTVPVCHESNR